MCPKIKPAVVVLMPGRDNGGGVMALVEQSIMHAPTDITIRVAAAAAAHD